MTEQEFWEIWASQKTDTPVIEYRLYYNDQGFPLFFSTTDEPGNYIVIDEQTFVASPKHIRVVDGKLIEYKTSVVKKLIPSDHGQCCHPSDVCIVVDKAEAHVQWDYKQLEKFEIYDN